MMQRALHRVNMLHEAGTLPLRPLRYMHNPVQHVLSHQLRAQIVDVVVDTVQNHSLGKRPPLQQRWKLALSQDN